MDDSSRDAWWPYLQQRMCIKFIKEIHDGVGVQASGAHDDVPFRLCSVR